MREFIAFDVRDVSILDSLMGDKLLTDRCARPVGRGEMHLTLNFLGEVEPDRNTELASMLDDAAGGMNAFEVEFSGVGAFPSASRPSVIWVGVVDRGETAKINSLLTERLGRAGFRTESRSFHPHITIARVKCRLPEEERVRFFKRWDNESFGRQEVSELVLKKSELTPRGALHSPLHNSRLKP